LHCVLWKIKFIRGKKILKQMSLKDCHI